MSTKPKPTGECEKVEWAQQLAEDNARLQHARKPISKPKPTTGEHKTHHNTCPRGERCACYLTGYTDAEYNHGLTVDSLDQPQPTGEWTHGMAVVEDGVPVKIPNAAVDMHNAALAAERDEVRIMTNQCVQLRQELADERDKANVRETELICERDYFKKELEAARMLK